jgi:acetyltransferase-like isoleucine patch superfamily enzyme
MEPPLNLPPPSVPPRVEIEGQDHDIQIAENAVIDTGVIVQGRGNRLDVGAGVSIVAFAPAGFAATVPDPASGGSHSIVIEGENNVVSVRAGTRLGVNLTIRGNGNRVEIGEGCHLHGFVNVLCSDATLLVGARTTMVQGSIQLHEPGEIVFGEDCMISSQVYVALSDIHPIYDRATGLRINPAASVHVGNHVWAGLRCMILKGARIGDGAVIAAGAIVSGDTPAHAIVAGAPARVLREDIEWRRDFAVATKSVATPAPLQKPRSRRRWWLFRSAT